MKKRKKVICFNLEKRVGKLDKKRKTVLADFEDLVMQKYSFVYRNWLLKSNYYLPLIFLSLFCIHTN